MQCPLPINVLLNILLSDLVFSNLLFRNNLHNFSCVGKPKHFASFQNACVRVTIIALLMSIDSTICNQWQCFITDKNEDCC